MSLDQDRTLNSQYVTVIPRFIRWAYRGEPLEVHGDLLQSRDFTRELHLLHTTERPGDVRHTVFETFGQFDNGLRMNENMIWFFRAAERGAVIEVLPDILTYRRIHRENLTKEQLRKGKNLATFFPILKAWKNFQQRQPDGEGSRITMRRG